jgi:hypothetical protein
MTSAAEWYGGLDIFRWVDENEPLEWRGVLMPELLAEAAMEAGHRLADAARAGDWNSAMRLLRSMAWSTSSAHGSSTAFASS